MPYFTHGETKNKLILLYLAEHAGTILTKEQLYRSAILNSEMEYFAFEEALSELSEDGLICEVPKVYGECIGATALGREALAMFEKSIPQDERRKLDDYLLAHRGDFTHETQISSRIEKTGSGVTLHLYITEAERTILSVSIAVPSEEQAMAMRSRWEKAGEPVYNYVWDSLTKERTD